MKVLICMKSGLSDEAEASASPVPVSGELTVAGNVLSIDWKQPPLQEETCGSLHRLSYAKQDRILHMKRTGENTTELSFSEEGRTKASLSTPYGDFEMEIETKQLLVPQELWLIAEKPADAFSVESRENSIQMHYFLHIAGQEPVENDITIQITLEKNEE